MADLTPLDYLRAHGWCKKANEAPDGSLCINGAVNLWDGLSAWNYETRKRSPRALAFGEALRDVILEQYPDRSAAGLAWLFNDHADTTLDDVELVLEKAWIKVEEAVA